MKVIQFTDIDAAPVDTEGAKGVTIRVLISEPDGAQNFRMRMFEVDAGGTTPYHQHPWEHEVFILEGTGAYVDEARDEHPLRQGSVVFVPPDKWHCFKNVGNERLRFLCLVPTDEVKDWRAE